jgi:hypothetical protein
MHAFHRSSLARCVALTALVSLSVGAVPGVASGAAVSERWVQRYHGPGDDAHDPTMVLSADGTRVFVTGVGEGSTGGQHYATVAYDASTGSRLWVRRYHGPGDDDIALARAVAVGPDGSEVFVTGTSEGSTRDFDYTTVAYDAATGTELWVERYDGTGHFYDEPLAIAVSPDGSAVFETGLSYGVAGLESATVGYDARTGSRLWVRRIHGAGGGSAAGRALGVSPDGSAVFVTGTRKGPAGDFDYATVAYEASTGAKLWARRYDGPPTGDADADTPTSLGVSPDGSAVAVTGTSYGSTGRVNYATVAYDASTGAERWTHRYDGPANDAHVHPALAVSPDGSAVFVTGTRVGSTGRDYVTLAYDLATGAKRWARRYDGPTNADDVAAAVAVSRDGATVVATGTSAALTGSDYATVAYDASTGSRLWARRHDGPPSGDNDVDEATSLGVGPDGSVFVTGTGAGRARPRAYATVAYRVG